MARAKQLTHVDATGRASMVDVGGKAVSRRVAVAKGSVRMRPETARRIAGGPIEKGDVIAVARIAGIQPAKRTGGLIPLCHPLPLDFVDVALRVEPDAGRVEIEAEARIEARTGIEMEALTAVAVAGLAIYDMCKAIDREMVIDEIRLVRKSGGRSGDYVRGEG